MADLSPVNNQTALLLEELGANAWPSLQTLLFDGWLLRFAEGYTRRTNSVYPIHSSSLDIREKIQYCERMYASKRQPCYFKITPAVHPANLDALLEAEGYAKEASTSVQTISLEGLTYSGDDAVQVDTRLSDRWLRDFSRLNSVNARHLATMTAMLGGLIPTHGFFSLSREEETASVGMAVLERGWVGLYDIVTALTLRHHGLGRQLVHHMLSWARSNGATHAYLQVMLDNAPALQLYDGIGFKEAYRYWYRVKKS